MCIEVRVLPRWCVLGETWWGEQEVASGGSGVMVGRMTSPMLVLQRTFDWYV